MDLFAQKKSIRLAMIEKRSLLPISVVQAVGKKVTQEILGLEEITSASRIGVYAAYRQEVSTEETIKKLRLSSQSLFFPRVLITEEMLEFVSIDSEQQMVRGYNGIMEPGPQLPAVDLNIIEVMLVPGVAFDERGGRIGWGKGFYDKTLAGFRGVKIGLAYDFQVVESIPVAGHDRKVDMVVTENRVIDCRRNQKDPT